MAVHRCATHGSADFASWLLQQTNCFLPAKKGKGHVFPKWYLPCKWVAWQSGRRLRFKWYSLCILLVHSVSSWLTSLWRLLSYGYAIQILQVRVALSEEQKPYNMTDWVPFKIGGFVRTSDDFHEFHILLELPLIFFNVKPFQVTLDKVKIH